jgi:hypothetical protein
MGLLLFSRRLNRLWNKRICYRYIHSNERCSDEQCSIGMDGCWRLSWLVVESICPKSLVILTESNER